MVFQSATWWTIWPTCQGNGGQAQTQHWWRFVDEADYAEAARSAQKLCLNLEHGAGGSDLLDVLSDIGPVAQLAVTSAEECMVLSQNWKLRQYLKPVSRIGLFSQMSQNQNQPSISNAVVAIVHNQKHQRSNELQRWTRYERQVWFPSVVSW